MSVITPIIKSLRATLSGGRANGSPNRPSPERHTDSMAAKPSMYEHQAKILGQARLDDAHFWLAAIADSSDDAIIGKNLDGLITSWNKAAERMFGYAAHEIIGQPVTRIIPLNRIDEEVAILKRVRHSEKIVHCETKRQCKNGSIIPVSLSVLPIRDDHGRIIGFSMTARDLRETQRVQRDLERREALLRSILDTVPDAMIVIDKQGFIQSFSPAAARLFGYTSEEMMGQSLGKLLPASDWEGHNSHLAGYVATGEQNIAGLGQRKDSSTFPMELAISEINLPGMRLFTAFVHDLTAQAERERDLRLANTELEQLALQLGTARDIANRSNRAKSRFLAGMSQELYTPLNGMLSYAQLLSLDGGLNAAQSERIDAMMGAGKHLLQMITSVVDLSEVEQVELQPVGLNALVVATTCLDLVRPAAEAKHLALSIAVAPSMRQELVTDPARLKQVLLNLLGNAVRFTTHGSVELRLRSVANGSVLRIEVADTGPGISVKDRRRLFCEFEPLEIEATRAVEGTGLGLALSARLATLMGGCLGHHDNPGGGSVFWMELPLDSHATPLEAMPAIADQKSQPPGTLHILVVDDVAMNRDIAACFLQAAGHHVTCLDNGSDAIAAAGATDFDVVLMDVRMPEMDGLEATRRIRSLGGDRGNVPIVALTAQAFSEQVAECRKAGMDSHLPKPFDPDTLLTAVVRAHASRPAQPEGHASTPAIAVAATGTTVIGAELLVCNPSAFERTAFYLAPEAITSYLEDIADRGAALLRDLRGADALVVAGYELAEAAHTIAGSAGMFGFERLTTVGRRFERAVQAGAADAPALAEGLTAALEVTLQVIYDRTLVIMEA